MNVAQLATVWALLFSSTAGGLEAVKVGAWLGITLMVAVREAVLKAVLPPLTLASAVPPSAPVIGLSPLVSSQALKVKVAGPP